MGPKRNGNGNGNGSDAQQAAYQFWKASRKDKKQWGDYTPVFQALENFLIGADFVDLPHRVLQLALQRSWGKHSDHCLDADGGLLSQAEFARILGKDRRRIHDCIQMWRDAGVLRTEDDGRIIPIWAPNAWLAKRSRPQRRPGAYRAWLRANRPEQADERETLVAKLKELDLRNLAEYKASRDAALSAMSGQPEAPELSDHSGQLAEDSPECPDDLSGTVRTPEKANSLISSDLSPDLRSILSTESSRGAAAAKVPATSPPPPSPLQNDNVNSQNSDDVNAVLEAFREFQWGDRQIAAETLQACRRRPAGRECTGEDVAKQVRKRAPEARQKDHPAAWLRGAVPWAFDDDSWKAKAAAAPTSSLISGRSYKYV